MHYYCPYCSGLKKAIKGQNYCSKAGDNMLASRSNAFYMSSNQMFSGEHISRLSVRGVLNGYQYYRAGKRESVVKQDNYLIVNEGQTWHSEVNSNAPVEMIVVAFHPDFLKKATYGLISSPKKLLNDPFFSLEKETNYLESTYPNDEKITTLFLSLKAAIISEQKDEFFFDQLYFELFNLIFQNHQNTLKQSTLLPAKNISVKKELYRRLAIAKDYVNAHLDKKLELDTISRIAALSPYHFLRLFKTLYQITPHQYLTQERMKRAFYLLQNTEDTIREISYAVGFEDQSAFGRVFKRRYGLSPVRARGEFQA